jgi:hypothetical protein
MVIRLIKIILILAIITIIIALLSSFWSYMKLEVANPLASGLGLAKIFLTDAEYVEIQQSPRVILAKPVDAYDLLLRVMQEEGYTYVEEETMGSMQVFEKDGKKERMFVSVNKFFSTWIWEKQ